MVAAASPPPAHAAPGRAHPTYSEALTELGGCSPRPAIAGYIIGRFSGFPACHDALLSAHLRCLLAKGVLRTHGQDYIFTPPEQSPRPGRPSATQLTKRSPSPTLATEDDAPLQSTKRGPTTQEFCAEASEATTFQNGGVQSGGASSSKRGRGRPRKQNPSAAAMHPSSTKRGRGRPRKEKPTEGSPTTGAAASRGFKRGCGRPSMGRASAPAVSAEATMDKTPSAATTAVSAESSIEKLAATAAAMYAETGDAAPSTGGGQSSMENLAAAVAAMSGEGTKRGHGRPRKEKPSTVAGAGVKRSRGSPGKDMMAETSASLEEEDSVSGEKKTQAEMGVATGGVKETRAASDAAGRVPISGENAAPAGATDPDLDPANLADAAASTGIKRPRGRPRKNKPSAAVADDGVSTGVKRGRGRPRMEKLEEAVSAETGDAAQPTGVKRGRGRPRKEGLEEGMSAETGVAAPPTVVKRGRGRPRKKRGAGRPKKDQSSGTGLAEAAGEALFRDMAEAPGDIGENRD